MTHRNRDIDLRSTLTYLSVLTLLTTAATGHARALQIAASRYPVKQKFSAMLAQAEQLPDSGQREQLVKVFLDDWRPRGHAIIDDTTAYIVYLGAGKRISVPSDLNGWDPRADTMRQLPGTRFFWLEKNLDPRARFEYKIAVDSTWILDPFNGQQAMGGFGPNSEIWMPQYRPPGEVEYRERIPHGTIDTFAVYGKKLGITHPVFVYRPLRVSSKQPTLPVLYVTDGGEYLSLGLMSNVLDNMIHDGQIPPLTVVFIDARTDVSNSASSKRMQEYTLNDTFVSYLADDVRDAIRSRYQVSEDPATTGIMGASLGGLIAVYAALERPDVFGYCAAQSPAAWWKDNSIIRRVQQGERQNVRFHIDTGTISDAQEGARRLRDALLEKGFDVQYSEYPEGHNWVNWRARIPLILKDFWNPSR